MQTYSHFLLTVWLRDRFAKRWANPHWAMVLGSVLPDIPLCLLTLWYFLRQYYIFGPGFPLFGPDYDSFYFRDPIWLTSHNIFHSPPAVAAWMAIGYFAGVKRNNLFWIAFFWFAIGCALHSVADIATHHDDGPLLWFPFDWESRFESPISYWDRRHYAAIVSPIEHSIDAVILGWVLVKTWRRRRKS